MKGVLLLMILLAMAGNVCYILADNKDLLVFIIVGRLVAGIGAGQGSFNSFTPDSVESKIDKFFKITNCSTVKKELLNSLPINGHTLGFCT